MSEPSGNIVFRDPYITPDRAARAEVLLDSYFEFVNGGTIMGSDEYPDVTRQQYGMDPYGPEFTKTFCKWTDANYDPDTGLYKLYRFIGEREADLIRATGSITSRAVLKLGEGDVETAQKTAQLIADHKVNDLVRRMVNGHLEEYGPFWQNIIDTTDNHMQKLYVEGEFVKAEKVLAGDADDIVLQDAISVSKRLKAFLEGRPMREILASAAEDEHLGFEDAQFYSLFQDRMSFTSHPGLIPWVDNSPYTAVIETADPRQGFVQIPNLFEEEGYGQHFIGYSELEWMGIGQIRPDDATKTSIEVVETI